MFRHYSWSFLWIATVDLDQIRFWSQFSLHFINLIGDIILAGGVGGKLISRIRLVHIHCYYKILGEIESIFSACYNK